MTITADTSRLQIREMRDYVQTITDSIAEQLVWIDLDDSDEVNWQLKALRRAAEAAWCLGGEIDRLEQSLHDEEAVVS